MLKVCCYYRRVYGSTGQPPPAGVPADAVSHDLCSSCAPASEPCPCGECASSENCADAGGPCQDYYEWKDKNKK